MSEVLASFYPTTVLLVDDNSSYLKSVIAILDDSKFCYKPFDSPHFALGFLNNLYRPPYSVRQFIQPYRDYVSVSTYRILYNFSRFTNISTLLIDYEMPGITGVEFCNAIKSDTKFNCVMLTGVATPALARNAMDNNVISHFVKKNDFNFSEKVMEIIRTGQIEFFKRELRELVTICRSVGYDLYILKNEYKQFFNDIVPKDSEGYYLLDGCGSFLSVKNNKFSAVFVWNKHEGEFLFRNFRNEYDLSVLNKLLSGETIICFPYKTENITPENLGVFMHTATKYNDEISYVYVEDASYFIKSQNIIHFEEYKSKLAFSDRHFSTIFNM